MIKIKSHSKILLSLTVLILIAGVLFVSREVKALSFIDIGLRINQGTQAVPDIQKIAIEDPSGSVSSPLMIAKGGTKYHVALVDPSDPFATKAHIKLASGIVRALRKLGSVAVLQDQTVMAIGHSSGSNTNFYASIVIANPTSSTITLTRTSYTLAYQEAVPPSTIVIGANSSVTQIFGSKIFPGNPAVPDANYANKSGTATYSISVGGISSGSVTYIWDYAI